MWSLRTFRADDLLACRGYHRTCPDWLPLARLGELYETWGPAWTMLHDDKIAFCGGLVLGWPGTANAWLMVRETPRGVMAFSLARATRRLLGAAAREFHLHRVDTVVDLDMRPYQRFAEWLGFTAEVMLHRYGPQRETFIQYVWFPGGD